MYIILKEKVIIIVIGTHARIANRASKDYLFKRRRAFVVVGSILPDINIFSHPHREKNLIKHIENNEKKIINGKFTIIKYIRLGNILHYLCDYFCYAHNENLSISHGKEHTKYELKLGREFKQNIQKRLENMPIEDKEELIKRLSQIKKNYNMKPGNSKRDLKYALSAVDYCVEYMIPKI